MDELRGYFCLLWCLVFLYWLLGNAGRQFPPNDSEE